MRWTMPNTLTVLRLIAAPAVALVFLVLPRPVSDWTAMILFVAASLTDYVDGYLARAWKQITAFGTPQEVDGLIREEVTKLGSPQGGLMMIYGLYPGIPLANVRALMDAMERYAGFYA